MIPITYAWHMMMILVYNLFHNMTQLIIVMPKHLTKRARKIQYNNAHRWQAAVERLVGQLTLDPKVKGSNPIGQRIFV